MIMSNKNKKIKRTKKNKRIFNLEMIRLYAFNDDGVDELNFNVIKPE